MRKLLIPVLAIAALGFGAATASSSGTTVRLKDDYFTPKSTSVAKGGTVTFRWSGKHAHNLMVQSGPTKFSVSPRTSGTYHKKFTRKGTYTLICSIHSGMSMKLRVR
jgi:plastocyanin